jgi:hypothetical protein
MPSSPNSPFRNDEVRGAVHAFLSVPGPAILDAIVDADEKPAMPDELKA